MQTYEQRLKQIGLEQDRLNIEIGGLKLALIKAKQESKPWPTNYGDEYWYITSFGDVRSMVWRGSTIDKRLHNVEKYCTAEKAETEIAKHIVLGKLRALTKGFKPIWSSTDDSNCKYFIYYGYLLGSWAVQYTFNSHEPNRVYFETEKDTRYAIDTLGDELDVLLKV